MNITTVTFGPEVDYVVAIYIDNELFKYGDEYHDDIKQWIHAFIAGVLYGDDNSNSNFIYHCEVPVDKCRDIIENGASPPEKFTELSKWIGETSIRQREDLYG